MTLFEPDDIAPVRTERAPRKTQAKPSSPIGPDAAEVTPSPTQEVPVAEVVYPSAPEHTKRLRLVVAYDGLGFHGFAAQIGQRTVAGEIRRALQIALQHEVALTCAGRTDTGVHAWGQVVHVDVAADADVVKIRKSLVSMLSPEIVVRDVEVVPDDFDARFDAQWRLYRYTIVNRPLPDPFRVQTAWWVERPLDLRRLRNGADVFLGEHDFAAFCRKGQEGTSTTRRIIESRWIDEGDGILRYEIQGTAFCWQMVRSIVGTLVEVGFGKRRPGDIMSILASKDRQHAGQLAPPQGLCLWEVGY